MAKTTKKFTSIIKASAAAIMMLLTVRVIDLQGFRGELFRIISKENRQFRVDIPAERGVFIDRYGEPLVMNTRSYFRYTNPLASYSDVEPITQEEALALRLTEPFSVGYYLHRSYTNPQSMGHVLGYTSVVTAEDLAADSTLDLTDVVGRLGLESRYDDLLRGNDGYQEFEVNALGEKQLAQTSQAPTPGQPLNTTLDPYLSTVAWRAMGERAGAVVILDGETGEVLSLMSTPSFNSNLFTPQPAETAQNQLRLAELQQALADERQLFFNRAISGAYAPGSVFKLVTAVAGLESDAFDLETTVDDQGVLEVGEQSFANWYYSQYGRTEGLISLVRAIVRSNDSFFYRAAEWTGIEALAEAAREFGFGEQTGIRLPGEQPGLVPDPAWKEQTFGERWFLGNTYHFGIGQGDLLVTPLQLARMVAVFGNDGQLCRPQVVAGENRAQTTAECSGLGISDETLSAVQEGMIGACSSGGTAFPFFDWNDQRLASLPEGISSAEQIRRGVAACKTGTAEFGSADAQGFRQTNAWFGVVVGGLDELLATESSPSAQVTVEEQSLVAETETSEDSANLNQLRVRWLEKVSQAGFPKTIVMMVLVESDENQLFAEGSSEAAPVARAIFDWMMGEPIEF